MLKLELVLNNTDRIQAQMRARGAEHVFKEFIQLYNELEKTGTVDPIKLTNMARDINLEKIGQGISAGNKLSLLINYYISLPNIIDESVPIGRSDRYDQILFQSIDTHMLPKKPLDYLEISRRYGILNSELSEKVSSKGFPFLFNVGPELEDALISYMKDIHRKNGFQTVSVPTIINEKSMFGTGAFPVRKEDVYHIEGTSLYLNPTAEMQLTNLVRGICFPKNYKFPIKIQAYARSFRQELGKEMTPFTTLHEFGKVELFVLTPKQTQREEYELLLNEVEHVLRGLELLYRKKLLCSGNMGVAAYKTIDFDVYAPGSRTWLEVSSCSMLSDFQTRRMNITHINPDSKEREYLTTLHASGTSIPRVLVGILENNQMKDGSIRIPDALRSYVGGKELIKPENEVLL